MALATKPPTLTGTSRIRVDNARQFLAADENLRDYLAGQGMPVLNDDAYYPVALGWAMSTVRQLLEVVDELTGDQR